MKFDNIGLPKDTGASDLQDSSRLAGMMVLFEWPQYIPINLYFTENGYVRHPLEYKYDFSRDQALCLVAGLWKANKSALVSRELVTGKDIFSPSHMGHIARCQRRKPSALQKAWLWADTVWNAVRDQKTTEANQLLAMIYVAYLQGEKSYLQYWLKNAKGWEEGIRSYWSGWRQESELAEHIIKN